MTCDPVPVRFEVEAVEKLKFSPKLGQPPLEHSGFRAHFGGGAGEPFCKPYRRLVSNGAAWPALVMVSTPTLHFRARVVKDHEQGRVQAFGPELAVEAFN